MVLGGFSYMRLGVDLFPKVEVPAVIVTTFFGADGSDDYLSGVHSDASLKWQLALLAQR